MISSMRPSCCLCKLASLRPYTRIVQHHHRVQHRSGSCCFGSRSDQVATSQTVLQRTEEASGHPEHTACPGFWTPLAIVLVLASGAAVALKTLIRDDKTLQAEYGEYYLLPNPETDPQAYKKAVARSKQSTHIHRAVAHMKSGEPVRAVVEIERALQANAICRSPLLCGSHTSEELQALYLLYIKNSEVPSNFAVLLQLRVLLGISVQAAEALEKEVLYTGEAFSI